MARVLVTGATGSLGGRLARSLLSDGHHVRVSSRRPDALDDLRHLGAEVVACDLRVPRSLPAVVAGVDIAVHATQALAPPDPSNPPSQVDGAGVRALVQAAAATGTAHVVLTSMRGVRPDHRSEFVRHKAAAEAVLRRSRLGHTIVRPSAFMETHVLRRLGGPLCRTGRVTLLGRGTRPRNVVSVEDVASAVRAHIADLDHHDRTTLEVVGPENLTDLEIVYRLAAAAGRTARVRHVPLSVARAKAAAARAVGAANAPRLTLAAEMARGDAADLQAREGRVIGRRHLADVAASWAAGLP